MAKIDLTSFEWCELIFKGKNKAYGAYKMRADSPKRHNVAMVIVLIIALVGFSLPTLIKWLPEAKRGNDGSYHFVAIGGTGSEAGRDEKSRAGGTTTACFEELY